MIDVTKKLFTLFFYEDTEEGSPTKGEFTWVSGAASWHMKDADSGKQGYAYVLLTADSSKGSIHFIPSTLSDSFIAIADGDDGLVVTRNEALRGLAGLESGITIPQLMADNTIVVGPMNKKLKETGIRRMALPMLTKDTLDKGVNSVPEMMMGMHVAKLHDFVANYGPSSTSPYIFTVGANKFYLDGSTYTPAKPEAPATPEAPEPVTEEPAAPEAPEPKEVPEEEMADKTADSKGDVNKLNKALSSTSGLAESAAAGVNKVLGISKSASRAELADTITKKLLP